jgi:succinate dehydrogenase/fumarate reductase flavoprotein subunit
MTKDLTKLVDRVINTDMLVVGSEGAGTTAALEAVKYGVKVTVVTKGSDVGRSGATVTGDADLDVDSRSLHDRFGLPQTDPRDNLDIFFEDIVKGGKFLNNQDLVQIHVEEAPERFQDLLDMGIKIDQVFHCSGHTYPRGAFIPGTRLMRAFRRALHGAEVDIVPYTMIVDILINQGQVAGAIGIDAATGELVAFKAKAVILATGGAMRMYPYTTAPEELTGDGLAIAYRAGVELVDMEFPMFLPGSFPWPPAVQGVDVPFILSTAGSIHGWLLNRNGDRFMRHWDPVNYERTTRDIASVAMMTEILAGRGSPHGGVYVSLKHLPDNLIDYIQEWKPAETLMQYGGFNMKDYLPDLKKDAIESVPASHFFNGGVKINTTCETNLPGLFAAGEVTGGVHGANRLSGNAFTEMLVWGHRSGKFSAQYAKEIGDVSIDQAQLESLRERILTPLRSKDGESIFEIRKHMQNVAWEKAGVIREASGLEQALATFAQIRTDDLPRVHVKNKNRVFNREWIQALELESMLLTMEMVCRTSSQREESRGSLYRSDHPKTDNVNFLKNQIVCQKDGQMCITSQPVVMTKFEPARKIVKYGETE